MAITKEKINDEITVTSFHKHIQVKEVITIKEDNVEISKSNHRSTYPPNTNVSSLDPEVAQVANAVWTEDIKNSYENYLDSLK